MLAGRVSVFRRCGFDHAKKAIKREIFEKQDYFSEEEVELRSELLLKFCESEMKKSYDQNKFAFIPFKDLTFCGGVS